MGFRFEDEKDARTEMHPVWRGIGCLLTLIIPIFSFALSDLIVQAIRANGQSIPANLANFVAIPGYGGVADFNAVLGLAALVTFALFAILLVVNSIIYSMMGSSNKSRFDAPAEKYKNRKKLK